MERWGLVSHVEQDLERTIGLGILPGDGSLPSEQEMARRYGVSRATIREALLRLATRGLVVQHPGRKSRAVTLDEALTLENLGVALHAARRAPSQVRRLLEGFLSLKRETTVELLAACCERASEAELRQLEQACYALEEAARWEKQHHWPQREFELLRLAARVANRPGHVLLIQSLERSFWGMATRVLPHLESRDIHQWAKCALNALEERNAQALRRDLLALLQATDEHLLDRLVPPPMTDEGPPDSRSSPAPVHDTDEKPHESHFMTQPPHEEAPEPEAAEGEVPGAVCQNQSGCQTALRELAPTEGPSPEPATTGFDQPTHHAVPRGAGPRPVQMSGSPIRLSPLAPGATAPPAGTARVLNDVDRHSSPGSESIDA
jgi:GntR family transcriptional regulator, transcriptional repressor for pyruvate dehydrogenase complex